MKEVLAFLKDLSANNNREWFAENKARYEKAKMLFDKSVEELLLRMSIIDPSLASVDVKDCLWRIYRDTRFSPDKTPYKRHFGAFIAKGGKKSGHGGYYLHIEPDNCFIGGGVWCPEPKLLKKLRQNVYVHIDEFLQITENKDFKKLYQSFDADEALKTVPREFPKDFSHPELLKLKHYVVSKEVDEAFFDKKNWLDLVVHDFEVLKPMNDFLNYAVDEYKEDL